MMVKLNTEPTSPLFEQLDGHIQKFKEKHFNINREWRYNFGAAQMRGLQELIDRREDAKIEDQTVSKGAADQTIMQRAIEAERKMKRVRMAKYSPDLFDELVMEMMREKRTMMEMMAELDVEDDKIVESQQRIANRRLKEGL